MYCPFLIPDHDTAVGLVAGNNYFENNNADNDDEKTEKEVRYTYQTDRKYTRIDQLKGHVFHPSQYMFDLGSKVNVEPGQVKVYITGRDVTIKGIEEDIPMFKIIAAKKGKNSFNFDLTDPRGSDKGRMKVILNKHQYVQVIYFSSGKYGEVTFFIPQRTKSLKAKEKRYLPITIN